MGPTFCLSLWRGLGCQEKKAILREGFSGSIAWSRSLREMELPMEMLEDNRTHHAGTMESRRHKLDKLMKVQSEK